MSQCNRVLQHLQAYGSITPLEAMQEYGIMRLGARIYDLKKKGIRIGSLILAVSIILATMLIKQHSVFDVLTAFVMAAVMYTLVYRYDLLIAVREFRNKRKAKPQIG